MKKKCVICKTPFESKHPKACFCSNRCKQQDKYWRDPEKYRQQAKDAYDAKKLTTKEKADV